MLHPALAPPDVEAAVRTAPPRRCHAHGAQAQYYSLTNRPRKRASARAPLAGGLTRAAVGVQREDVRPDDALDVEVRGRGRVPVCGEAEDGHGGWCARGRGRLADAKGSDGK